MLNSETVLWSGVVMQDFDSMVGGLKFKTRALLTENAIIWSSIRDADHPIRIEYNQMNNPRLAMRGITGGFFFIVSDDTESEYTREFREIQWLSVAFLGVSAAFMDALVPLVPRLTLDGHLLRDRYRSRLPGNST
jgi:hypothetical protein